MFLLILGNSIIFIFNTRFPFQQGDCPQKKDDMVKLRDLLQTIYGESKGIGSFSTIDLLYKSVLGLPEVVHLDLSGMLMISLDMQFQLLIG